MKSAEMIGWAIGGIEREIMSTRERLAALTAQAAALRSKLPGGTTARGQASTTTATTGGAAETPRAKEKRRRRKMSPEARKRISDMMKKRWAERRKAR